MIINIRGTNGSGKTTLARTLIGEDAKPVDLFRYASPTVKDPTRMKWVEGWGTAGGFLAVGSYRQGCGGLDTIPSFEIQQSAVANAVELLAPPPRHVICEGVLASTVYGSWATFFQTMQREGHKVLVAYLDTPTELCLERIWARQKAAKGSNREIKVDLVRDKVKAINATRAKFEADGIATATIRHDQARWDLLRAVEKVTGERQ